MKQKYLKWFGMFAICGSLVMGTPVWGITEEGKRWEYVESEGKQGNVYEFPEISITIPKSWDDKFETEIDDSGIGFYQTASMDAAKKDGLDGAGFLFWLNYSEDYDFVKNLPNFYMVGSGSRGIYYITVPSGLSGYEKDKNILNEWKKMSEDVENICKTAVSENPGVPVYTTDDVNLRKKGSKESKVMDVIPSDSLVWLTGHLEGDWVSVNYEGEKGYIDKKYISFPEDIPECLGAQSDETEDDQKQDDKNTDKDTGKKAGGNAPDSRGRAYTDIEGVQGAVSAMLYNKDGKEVRVRKYEDGNWYGDDGLYYGDDDAMDEAMMENGIVNENGEEYFIHPPKNETNGEDGEENPEDGSEEAEVVEEQ